MALSPHAPRLTADHHLDALLAEVDELAALVAGAPADARRALAQDATDDRLRATLALDGADPAAVPSLRDARQRLAEQRDAVGSGPATPTVSGSSTGSWLDAFGALHEPPDELVQALEVVGAAAGLAAHDLAASLVGSDAAAALRELHSRITAGLVAPERRGAPRTSAQAVHDASVGRVLYLTVEPDRIVDELERLTAWLAQDAGTMHPVAAAAALEGELLRIHPFDAANGRLARTAAGLLLRAGGTDPDGVAAPEVVLAEDPMGYHQAMADTLRRRDLTRWTARGAEAVAAGLRTAARQLRVLHPEVPDHAAAFVDDASEPSASSGIAPGFTFADYLAIVGGDRDRAGTDLRALLDSGRIERVLGSHGLRFRVRRRPDA